MSLLLILAGLIIGILVGLTGVGGGSLMTPLLIFMGLDPLIAVGTDLLYSLPTKIFGAYIHRRQNTLRFDIIKPLCIGGLPAAIVGLVALGFADRFVDVKTLETWIRHAIGFAVTLSALMILISPFLLRNRTEQQNAAPLKTGRLIGIGAVVGLIVSITSVGSGAVALPLLVLCVPGVALADLVGTDIAFAAILVFTSVLGHMKMGHVNYVVTGELLLGSLAGVFIGSKLCVILRATWLRPTLAAVLVLAGTRLL